MPSSPFLPPPRSRTYDGTGRTLTVTAADASVTHYEYKGNTTKVTDPAGKWKKFTNDAMGNLVQVNEPDPAAGADYLTSYTYNGMNRLTQVSMPRHGYQQTRTFVWNGADMTSATNPENGTVTYGYDAAHRMVLRTDAKAQKTHYVYDAYGRLTSVWHEVLVNAVRRTPSPAWPRPVRSSRGAPGRRAPPRRR